VRFGRGMTTPNSPANAIDRRSDLLGEQDRILALTTRHRGRRRQPQFCCKSEGLAIGQAWDGNVYCCAILDCFSRMIVPRTFSTTPDAALVTRGQLGRRWQKPQWRNNSACRPRSGHPPIQSLSSRNRGSKRRGQMNRSESGRHPMVVVDPNSKYCSAYAGPT
jgi:transposase InsO family protein